MTETRDELTRRKITTLTLLAFSILVIYLCYEILKPFFPVLSWSLALTVMAYPIHRFIGRRISDRNVSAFLSVCAVSILILLPIGFVVKQIADEAGTNYQLLTQMFQADGIQQSVRRIPWLGSSLDWFEHNTNIKQSIGDSLERLNQLLPRIFAGSLLSIVQLALVLFTIFFFFRDRHKVLTELRELVPLSDRETSELFTRISDTIYATLFGTLVVSCVQGALGGLIFWFLGLPGPVLWGTVMALLALIPYLGAFIIWVPAAVFLAIDGSWEKALILTFWGVIVVGLIDNLLYPILVGKRLRFHTLPVFFFILGGLFFFGTSGLILGPLTLSVADALLDTWKRRLNEPNGVVSPREKVAL